MSITLSHTRLTKQTSLIHSHTLAYCQATRSHSMHALAVMHFRSLSHTHHDRVSRVGSGSVLREVCACAVVTTSSLLLLSCGKRPVSALRVLPSPFSLLLRFPLRCRYQSQRSPAAIIISEKRCILNTFPATSHRQRMCRPAANPPFPPNSGRLFDRAQDGLSTRATSDASRGPAATSTVTTFYSYLLTRFNMETRKPTCSYTSLTLISHADLKER